MSGAVRPFRRTPAASGGVLDHVKSQRDSCGSASVTAPTTSRPATDTRRPPRR